MNATSENRIPWFLWPFAGLWELLTLILNLTGRLALALVGLALGILGLVLTVTVVAAPVGIPLAVLGLALMLRSVF